MANMNLKNVLDKALRTTKQYIDENDLTTKQYIDNSIANISFEIITDEDINNIITDIDN